MAAPTTTHTLVVPAVSMGNVCQLAADLLVVNFAADAASPAARVVSEHVEPAATADALATGKLTGALSTPIEVFPLRRSGAEPAVDTGFGAYGRVSVLQIRSVVLPGHSRALAREVVGWAQAHGYSRVLVLCGASAFNVPYEARVATRAVADRAFAASPDSLAGALAATSLNADRGAEAARRVAPVVPLERELGALDFTGLLKPVLDACAATAGSDKPVAGEALVRYVFEGDNRDDGYALAGAAAAVLGLRIAGSGLVAPFSWRLAAA